MEVPCRDTDCEDAPLKLQRNDTVAFTINFGEKSSEEDLTKKFERFAQRSSQRRINSPKQRRSNVSDAKSDLKHEGKSKHLIPEGNILDEINDGKTKDDATSTSGTYTGDEESEEKKVSQKDKIFHLQMDFTGISLLRKGKVCK